MSDDEVNPLPTGDPTKLRIASTRRHVSRSYFALHHKYRLIWLQRPSLPEIIGHHQQRDGSQLGNCSNHH